MCAEYKQNYINIFKQIYPAKNSTGFTERNLSVNFSKAYETLSIKINQNCITWYEFQFGNANNEHYDAIIIIASAKEILVIESKRYSILPRKITSTINDIDRINHFPTEISSEHICRIPDFNLYKIYGVVLADIWTGNTTTARQKNIIKEQYLNNTFIKTNKYIEDKDKLKLCNREFIYNVQNFGDCTNLINYSVICNNYYLLSIMWELPV